MKIWLIHSTLTKNHECDLKLPNLGNGISATESNLSFKMNKVRRKKEIYLFIVNKTSG